MAILVPKVIPISSLGPQALFLAVMVLEEYKCNKIIPIS